MRIKTLIAAACILGLLVLAALEGRADPGARPDMAPRTSGAAAGGEDVRDPGKLSDPTSPVIDLPAFDQRLEGPWGAPLRWDPDWPRFGLHEWVISGAFGAAAATFAIWGPVGTARWRSQNGLDTAVRDTLRAVEEQSRRVARDISDVLLTTLLTYSITDALLVAGWYRRSPDVAAQMALIDMEVFAVTGGIVSTLKSLTHRERPYGRGCGSERPDETRDCESSDREVSFPSGHTAQTFAAAAVSCSHHINLGLYRHRWADNLSCAAGFTLAATTGLFRIIGDQHYLTDVLAGAGIGTLVGFGVPWLFHYRGGASPRKSRAAQLQLLPYPVGAMAVGTF